MPELLDTEISCGIRQLSGLCKDPARFNPRDRIPPKQVLLEAFDTSKGAIDENWTHYPETVGAIRFGVVLFSDSVRRGNGLKLVAYIKAQKLGKVTVSPVIENPNTGNDIQLFTWYLDRKALVAWIDENHDIYNCSSYRCSSP